MANSNVCVADCRINNKAYPYFRPRGALSRALYYKHINDNLLKSFDRDQWYNCDTEILAPEIRRKFIKFDCDSETEAFIESSEETSDSVFLQIWYSLVKTILSWFISQTNINGLLKRGSMFVFSSKQLGVLLDRPIGSKGTLIDLGAGDGKVTRVLANFYSDVIVTEVATTMKWLLKKSGFKLLDIEEWPNHTYDTISCLNLLDRCSNPVTVLKTIKKSLKPEGKVILAIVLPYKPYVESGSPDHKPFEYIPIHGNGFEEQVNSMVEDFLKPLGFVVERWTRLPYLSEGDLSHSYYFLDDAVFILRHDHDFQE